MEMETQEPSDLIAPSLMALLHETVDYAGLFPPADLPLSDAIHNYADYRGEPQAWMLSRFVLPVRRLSDLEPYQSLFRNGDPYVFSVLGTGGEDPKSFLAAFRRDLDLIDAFDEHHAGRTTVDVMEVRLPKTLLDDDHDALVDFFERVDRALVSAGTAKLDLFFEVPVTDDTAPRLPEIAAAMAEMNSRQPVPERCELGLKIRCGGMEPSDVPEVAPTAAFIVACRDAGVRFKATAGLHHPIRHYDDSLECEMHGFINVFGAATLASELDLDVPTVQAVLQEDIAENFQFLKDAFGWRDLLAPIDAIDHVRQSLAISFGSCSFEEPVDDLRELELL